MWFNSKLSKRLEELEEYVKEYDQFRYEAKQRLRRQETDARYFRKLMEKIRDDMEVLKKTHEKLFQLMSDGIESESKEEEEE
jgi:hypothetical protein